MTLLLTSGYDCHKMISMMTTAMATTQEIPVTDVMLDAAFPRERLARRHDDCATPAELICDAVDAAAMRESLADTQEMPAVDDDMVDCHECGGWGYGAGGDDCECCGGSGRVPFGHVYRPRFPALSRSEYEDGYGESL